MSKLNNNECQIHVNEKKPGEMKVFSEHEMYKCISFAFSNIPEHATGRCL